MHYDTSEERNKEGLLPHLGYSYGVAKGNFYFDTGVAIFTDSYDQPSATLFSNISHKSLTYEYFTPSLKVGIVSKGDNYEDDSRQIYPYVLPCLKVGKSEGIFLLTTVSPLWASIELGYSW